MERFSTDRNKPWNSDLPTVWKIAVSCQYPGRAENPSDIIADMEKVYQSIQKVAAKKGLTFLMLLPDITAKVSGEPVDLL